LLTWNLRKITDLQFHEMWNKSAQPPIFVWV